MTSHHWQFMGLTDGVINEDEMLLPIDSHANADVGRSSAFPRDGAR